MAAALSGRPAGPHAGPKVLGPGQGRLLEAFIRATATRWLSPGPSQPGDICGHTDHGSPVLSQPPVCSQGHGWLRPAPLPWASTRQPAAPLPVGPPSAPACLPSPRPVPPPWAPGASARLAAVPARPVLAGAGPRAPRASCETGRTPAACPGAPRAPIQSQAGVPAPAPPGTALARPCGAGPEGPGLRSRRGTGSPQRLQRTGRGRSSVPRSKLPVARCPAVWLSWGGPRAGTSAPPSAPPGMEVASAR